ncbi:MAG: hypothetical protein AB7V56_17305 [Candidatus Nitrosocosmicus sp.]
MKVKLEVVIVMMASVFVGVSSTTSVFGGLLDGTPVSIPDIRNSNGSLFYNTPVNTPDASNSDIEVNNNQSIYQKGDLIIGGQNCAEINVNSQNSAGDEGLDCHNIQDQSPENPSEANSN